MRRNLAAAEARILADPDEQEAEQFRALLPKVAQTAQRESLAPVETDC